MDPEAGESGSEGLNPPTRTFYSTTSGTEFLNEMREDYLAHEQANKERQEKADLRQEAFLQQINSEVTKLTSAVQTLIQALKPPTPPIIPLGAPPEIRSNPADYYTPPPRGQTPYGVTYDPRERTLPPQSPQDRTPPVRGYTVPPDSTSNGGDTSRAGRIPGIKPQKFYGRDGENILAWLHKMDAVFTANGVPEEMKVANACTLLRDDADSYYYYLVVKNNGIAPSWRDLTRALISKYENTDTRQDALRQKLRDIKYQGHSQMAEFCERFRIIEAQIYEMAFPDRLYLFTSNLPSDLALHLKDQQIQRSKDMEVVYQYAREWAATRVNSRPTHHPHHHRRTKPLLKFG